VALGGEWFKRDLRPVRGDRLYRGNRTEMVLHPVPPAHRNSQVSRVEPPRRSEQAYIMEQTADRPAEGLPNRASDQVANLSLTEGSPVVRLKQNLQKAQIVETADTTHRQPSQPQQ